MTDTKTPTQIHARIKWFSAIFLVFFVLLGACYGVYAWQGQRVSAESARAAVLAADLQGAKSQVSALQAQLADAKSVASPAQTTDEKVIATVKAYCEAQVNPVTKKPLVFQLGKGKALSYSPDGKFVHVNHSCTYDQPSAADEVSSVGATMKETNEIWIVVSVSQEERQAELQRFGVPVF